VLWNISLLPVGNISFSDMSPVVNNDVFADEMIDLAPTTKPLLSQLVDTENIVPADIVPAAGSLGRPAAGSPFIEADQQLFGCR
jgi:hypothetical protein